MFESFNKMKVCYDYYDKNESLPEEIYSELMNFQNDSKNSNKKYESLNVFENFSEYRTNIFKWYPFKKNSRILEINAECGAITGFLNKLSSDLVSITSSKLSSEIIKSRYSNAENFYLYIGRFIDIEFDDLPFNTFDYIIVVGGILTIEELSKIKSLLSDDGNVLIATENKYGEQYFSGCSDRLIKNYYNGINGYLDTVYSKKTWLNNILKVGFSEVSVKYPYPNYRFCESIFSDNYLPDKNQLYKKSMYANKQDLVTFEDNLAFNFAIENGFFQNVSNSFLFEIGKASDVDYVKFSIEREAEKQIFTVIENSDHKRVKKYQFSPNAHEHLKNVSGQEQEINRIFGGKFIGCPCKLKDDHIDFEFIDGKSLAHYISESVLERKTTPELFEYLKILKDAMKKISTRQKFVASEDFVKFFCTDCADKKFKLSKYSFIDLIPDNIIINNDNRYIIDYEWVLSFPVPVEFIIFRSIFTNSTISSLCFEERKKIYDFFGIRIEDYNYFLKMEKQFQKMVCGSKEGMTQTLQRLSPLPYDTRLIDYKSFFYNTQVYDGLTGDIIARKTTSTNEFSMLFNPGKAKNIKIVLCDKNIFLSSIKITAIRDDIEFKELDYSHNASFVCNEEMIFLSVPTLEVVNDNYSEIKLQFTAYLWNSSIVNYIFDKNTIIKNLESANNVSKQ